MPTLRRRRPQPPRRPPRRRPHDQRTDWPQIGATLTSIASVLLVALGLFYTNDQNRKQQELAERGQVTERFTKAIDQLGSDKLDVRLGGIYGLERLMRDSPNDRRNIVDLRPRACATVPSNLLNPRPSSKCVRGRCR